MRVIGIGSAAWIALASAGTASAQVAQVPADAPAAPTAAQTADAADAPPPVAPAVPTPPAIVNGRTVYEAAFFATFSPATALDVINRVPGFVLDEGATDVRGFGGAAGNVVINGARPSAKDDTLETILSRIPAQRVLRVEVGGGDRFGAEFVGRAQVANLVMSDAGGLAGNVQVDFRRDFSGEVRPAGTASALFRRGPSTFNLSVELTNRHRPEEGPDRLVALPSGSLIEWRDKYNDVLEQGIAVAGSWVLDQGTNRTARLNARFSFNDFVLNQTNAVFPTVGTPRDDRLAQDYDQQNYEIGGDITRPLFGGGIKLIGLVTRQHRLNFDSNYNRVAGATIGGFEQFTDDSLDESVLRLVWSGTHAGWSIETGLEGTLNRLRSDVGLFSILPGGGRTRVDLPIDQATVTEYRAEAFVNAGRQLASNLRLDAGLTLEVSRLTVSGDTEAERSLRFLKPRLVLDWRPGGGWRTQLTMQRTVAQLDFYDFISAAELANERVSAGNANLLPQRAWEAVLTVERPILGNGAARLEMGYQRISMLQDRVPTPEGFDAPGNIGNATFAYARGTLDAPLDRIGIRGGRLTLNATVRDMTVTDPYTLRPRQFSGFDEWRFEAAFRQDLGSFAWGVNFTGSPPSAVYRRDEVDSFDGQEPYVTAFAEYRLGRRNIFTLTVDNLFDVAAVRQRVFYRPDRRTAEPFMMETRERSAHPSVTFRFRRTFG